jgi:hypothetical protein
MEVPMAYVMKRVGWMSIVVMFFLMTACSVSVERPTDPKTVFEQLLISQALEKSLTGVETEFSQEAPLVLEVSGLTTDQTQKDDITQRHVKKVIAGWLGEQGFVTVEDSKEATFRVQAIVETIGVRQGIRFLGMPAADSALLPVAIPELALWKRNRRQGYIRFYLDIYETATGRLVHKTKTYTGSVIDTNYTAFFIFRWEETELDEPLERF